MGRPFQRDLSVDGGGRTSNTRGFFRRLFRSNRSSRQASETRPSLLQILEIASLLQGSRSADGRNSGGEEQTQMRTDDEALGFPRMSGEDGSGIPRLNGEDGLGLGRVNHDEGLGLGLGRLNDAMLGPGALDILMQRFADGLLQSGRHGSPPASKAAVAAMPTLKISKQSMESMDGGGLDEELNQCAVCKEAFEIGGEVREMPCKHFYHSNCILPWLELHSSCPLCRHEMPVDVEEHASSSTTTTEGMAAFAGGERTIVLIGIFGAGVHVFSFIVLGHGNRSEPTIPESQGGGDAPVAAVAEDERVEDESEREGEPTAGLSSSGGALEAPSSLNDDAGVATSEADDVLNETILGAGQVCTSQNNDAEHATGERDPFGRRKGGLQASAPHNDVDIEGERDDISETRLFRGASYATSSHDHEAGSSTGSGADTVSERRLRRLITDSRPGNVYGGRSRSFFSWFFRHANSSHASTSSAVQGRSSNAEGNVSDGNSTSQSHNISDNKAT